MYTIKVLSGWRHAEWYNGKVVAGGQRRALPVSPDRLTLGLNSVCGTARNWSDCVAHPLGRCAGEEKFIYSTSRFGRHPLLSIPPAAAPPAIVCRYVWRLRAVPFRPCGRWLRVSLAKASLTYYQYWTWYRRRLWWVGGKERCPTPTCPIRWWKGNSVRWSVSHLLVPIGSLGKYQFDSNFHFKSINSSSSSSRSISEIVFYTEEEK